MTFTTTMATCKWNHWSNSGTFGEQLHVHVHTLRKCTLLMNLCTHTHAHTHTHTCTHTHTYAHMHTHTRTRAHTHTHTHTRTHTHRKGKLSVSTHETRGAQQSTYPVRNFDLTATTDYSYSMHDELARPRFTAMSACRMRYCKLWQ